MILAIDPSDTRHAWALLSGTPYSPRLHAHGRDVYGDFCEGSPLVDLAVARVVIEQIASYGMAAGAHLFDTCVEIGRLMEQFPGCQRITRTEVKMIVCGRSNAKDTNVRASIIDCFGGPASIRKGGPLYGVAKDTWAAIAVGLAAMHPVARYYVPAHLRAPVARLSVLAAKAKP